jgi:DNA repair protein RecO (recombination protein O)
MNWDDKGYLLSKNRYSENSIIADFYTENHGKTTGIIFGATSKKIKNYLEIGNKLFLNYNYKNEDRLGYFKIEILKALSPLYFDNQKKLMCLASAMGLIRLLTAQLQENNKIFKLINNFYILLEKDSWIQDFIFWELELLKLVGYDLELKNIVIEEIINNKKKYYVKSNNEKKIVPNFLIEENFKEIDTKVLLKGLKLVGDFLDKSILKPNNINYPNSRLLFVNLLK